MLFLMLMSTAVVNPHEAQACERSLAALEPGTTASDSRVNPLLQAVHRLSVAA